MCVKAEEMIELVVNMARRHDEEKDIYLLRLRKCAQEMRVKRLESLPNCSFALMLRTSLVWSSISCAFWFFSSWISDVSLDRSCRASSACRMRLSLAARSSSSSARSSAVNPETTGAKYDVRSPARHSLGCGATCSARAPKCAGPHVYTDYHPAPPVLVHHP